MFTSLFADHQAFLLYPDVAVGSGGVAPAETPTLQPFAPPNGVKPNGAAMIVCPGGGYGALAPHEAGSIARWLAQQGITAFVLRYRLTPHHHPVELSDGQRAIRFVRHHAASWGLDGRRIGILGFSAGGHLAASTAVHFDAGNPAATDPLDRSASRPQVQVLIYPFLTLEEPLTHVGCRTNLLGEEFDPKLIELLTCQRQIKSDTPPAFIFHSTLDSVVPVAATDNYVAALKAKNIACTYIRGEYGEHGIGLHDCWKGACQQFLREQGF